MEKTITTKCEG